MKAHLLILQACLILLSCGNDNTQAKVSDAPKQDATKQSEVSDNTATEPSGDGIVGSWKLKLEAYDSNENNVLDEDERKKGIKNNYAFQFKADGSCKIQQTFSGRYEVKTGGGKQMLYVYRARVVGEEDKDPVPDIYRIISMNKTELVLLEQEGNLTFWVFERVG